MCNYCSHGTLLRNSALQVLAGVFATATKICTHGGSTRALALTASKLTVASFLLVGSTLVKKANSSPDGPARPPRSAPFIFRAS